MTIAEAFTSRLRPKRGGCFQAARFMKSNEGVAARVRRTLYPTLRDSLQPTPTCTQVDAHDYHPVGRPNSGSRLSLQVLSGQRL